MRLYIANDARVHKSLETARINTILKQNDASKTDKVRTNLGCFSTKMLT